MAVRVKAKGKWKPVNIDHQSLEGNNLDDFICMNVLTQYELVGPKEEEQTVRKKAKKEKHKNTKLVPNESPGDMEERGPKEKGKTSKAQKKKKKKMQKTLKNAKGDVDANNPTETGMHLEKSELRIIQATSVGKRKHSLDTTPIVGKKRARKTEKGASVQELKTDEVTSKSDADLDSAKGEKDMSRWSGMFVPDPVLQALSDAGFEAPTQIQVHTLPSAISGRKDILGAAETGSGKTLAFGIPMIHNILQYKAKHPSGSDDAETNGSDGDDDDGNDDEGSEGAEETSETEDSDDESGQEDPESDSQEGEENSGAESEEFESDDNGEDEDEEVDLPPEEDEEFAELADAEMGCVASISNVEFDWLEDDICKVETDKKSAANKKKPLLGLVLTPTRELAVQVKNHLQVAAAYTGIQVCCVVGGMSSEKQSRLLRRCPEIVVATPGRLWELIQLGDPHLSKVDNVGTLVIDEADRMVEKGHYKELDNLFSLINSDQKKRERRQNFVFSATLTLVHSGPTRMFKKKKKTQLTSDSKLDSLVAKIGLRNKPKVIDLTRKVGTAETLVESRITCSKEEKDFYLYYFLQHYKGRTLVFTNSKDCLRRLVSLLTLLQLNPLPLHADMHQRQRLKNLDRFKAKPNSLLLATDVAARGLDIPDVQHVIHYQVPRTSENYIHRSGRTARVKKEGLSVVLVGPEDMAYYRKIIRTLNRSEDLPVFPVESQDLTAVRERVCLARRIDVEEHRVSKASRENNWFEKAAKEMDIILDDHHLLNDVGDKEQQAQQRNKAKVLRQQLKSMLTRPVLPKMFSGKYPTKYGKLTLPSTMEPKTESACAAVKEETASKKKLLAQLPARTKRSRGFKKKKSKNKNP